MVWRTTEIVKHCVPKLAAGLRRVVTENQNAGRKIEKTIENVQWQTAHVADVPTF